MGIKSVRVMSCISVWLEGSIGLATEMGLDQGYFSNFNKSFLGAKKHEI